MCQFILNLSCIPHASKVVEFSRSQNALWSMYCRLICGLVPVQMQTALECSMYPTPTADRTGISLQM